MLSFITLFPEVPTHAGDHYESGKHPVNRLIGFFKWTRTVIEKSLKVITSTINTDRNSLQFNK
jgi:hypothetical protein